jgi:ATP-binding cassette, subfamily B, bacterial
MDARLAVYVARLQAQPDRQQRELTGEATSTAVSFGQSVRSAGLGQRFSALLALHALETGLLIAGWAFIGSGALNGRPDRGWVAAWALCVTSIVLLRMTTRWLEGVVAVGFGGLLKERLLAGATTIDPEVMRRTGAGELLGQVLEAETIERLGADGGLQTVLAALELLVVPFVLGFGAAPRLEIAVLMMWTVIALAIIVANTRQRTDWTKRRLELSHQLIEAMTAHRTRLAQQSASAWHREEDRQHARYADASKSLDRSTAWIEAVVPRGYVIAALAALAPSFMSGETAVAELAITLGAILFAGDAFGRLTFGLADGAAAWIAWRGVRPLVDRAPQPAAETSMRDVPSSGRTALRAEDVVFTHGGRAEPAVKGCTLTVEQGDFLLLEGGSGSGKSTLISLLGGARKPSAGIILAGGLDLPTLGLGRWRRRIAIAPQHHENHILSAPLGFNLLLGRPYPHSEDDYEEARAVCLDLGLGPLLERMPGGLEQMVGETGWQLSQGERNRVFLARALLQNADVVLLDESLAALDPETQRQCQRCLFRRAKTLLMVAHP